METKTRVLMDGKYAVVCRAKDGKVKWIEDISNIVTNAGLDHILSSTIAGGSQITTWYVGLTDGTPTVDAADTMSSHAGWVEVQNYSQANRVTFTAGAVSGQSVSNTASKAQFSINQNATTIGGAFLVSNNTKGGTTGTLYSVGAFTGGDKTADNGDTLEVTGTFSSADDGV